MGELPFDSAEHDNEVELAPGGARQVPDCDPGRERPLVGGLVLESVGQGGFENLEVDPLPEDFERFELVEDRVDGGVGVSELARAARRSAEVVVDHMTSPVDEGCPARRSMGLVAPPFDFGHKLSKAGARIDVFAPPRARRNRSPGGKASTVTASRSPSRSR